MPYSLPTFNLTMDWWNWPVVPGVIAPPVAPTFGPVPCQMYFNSRVIWPGTANIFVRFPEDLTGNLYGFQDVFEAPSASGRYWRVIELARIHEGFTNVYWAAKAIKCDGNGATVKLQQLP